MTKSFLNAKYFLNRLGVPTQRLVGKPGAGHIEVAATTEVIDPNQDVYQQMFSLGYVRIVELDTELHVDAPRPMSKAQKAFVDDKRIEGKKQIFINSREVRESRTDRVTAAEIVRKLIA